MPLGPPVAAVDPFDLPDWLGERPVTWAATSPLRSSLIAGCLASGDERLACDVLAGDQAHPVPVLADPWRGQAQQAWALGEVLLVRYDDRLTLVVPGLRVGVEEALEALRRLARAVAAQPGSFAVHLQL